MKHPLAFMLALAILATVALVIWISVTSYMDYSQSGLTPGQKANAMKIALSSGLISPLDNTTDDGIGDIKRPGPDFYTYDNNLTSIAVIPVNYRMAMLNGSQAT